MEVSLTIPDMAKDIAVLLGKLAQGDVLATSRLISLVEEDEVLRERISKAIAGRWGKVPHVGITGPPGVGKSTLVDQLIALYREEGKKVGVVAVDPTSPFSGGAILGDRIRMGRHAGDDGVFIRSMASRGQKGGISYFVRDACRILEASGKEIVFVETAGVGQVEIDIARACHTTLLVLMPQTGDSVQTLKAGILEAADIIVINKKELPGTEKLFRELHTTLQPRGSWHIPVIKVEALRGEGMATVKEKIEAHFQYLHDSGEGERRKAQNLLEEVLSFAQQEVEKAIERQLMANDDLKKKLQSGEWTPRECALYVLKQIQKDL